MDFSSAADQPNDLTDEIRRLQEDYSRSFEPGGNMVLELPAKASSGGGNIQYLKVSLSEGTTMKLRLLRMVERDGLAARFSALISRDVEELFLNRKDDIEAKILGVLHESAAVTDKDNGDIGQEG